MLAPLTRPMSQVNDSTFTSPPKPCVEAKTLCDIDITHHLFAMCMSCSDAFIFMRNSAGCMDLHKASSSLHYTCEVLSLPLCRVGCVDLVCKHIQQILVWEGSL